jgi:hypothetical protein
MVVATATIVNAVCRISIGTGEDSGSGDPTEGGGAVTDSGAEIDTKVVVSTAAFTQRGAMHASK